MSKVELQPIAKLEIKNGLLCVNGSINFENVMLVCKQGTTLMKTLETVEVNLHGLSQSDSSVLALLADWVREANALNKKIVFTHMPLFMRNITRVCGLDGVLPIVWEN